jgi:tetratricopeptide (TPR) repeat protein
MKPFTSRRLTLVLIVVGAPVLLAAAAAGGLSVARAQGATITTEQKQEMKLHYERAQRAFDIAKYADAIDEYAKVYEIGGNPAMLFNIAQAHRLNNQLPEASRFYRRYLQRAPNAPNRADVEQKIAEIEKIIERGGDGRGAAAAPIAATPAPAAAPLSAAPPATTSAPAPVVLPPPPPPPPARVETAPVTPSSAISTEPPPASPSSGATSVGNPRLWAVVALSAVGAGGLVLASFEGLNASSKADALTAQSKQGKIFDPALETSGRRANAIAITSAIVGGLALVAAGVLFFTGPTSSGGETATIRISVAPLLVPGGLMGAGASWTY